jgi:LPXTG-site transpeptidase (sortase) family protein
MRSLATLLILAAIVLGGFAIWRGFFHYPNEEDAGLTAAVAEAASTSAGKVVGNPGVPSAGESASALPSRLIIPKLGIDTDVQRLGLTKKGNMAAPSNFTDVSWYKLGTVPGEVGSAVMAGHEDNAAGLDGVFKHLDELKEGDDVYVVNASGAKLHFQVTGTAVYPYNLSGAELKKVFAAADAARLNLITCAGTWIQSLKTNDKRLVVFTKLVK